MRYTYKVRELSPEIKDKNGESFVEVGEPKELKAMSFKKLRLKLDPNKKYHVEYRNKKENFVSATTSGVTKD
tara:strand:- start:1703 stop:1918 length:216 start_codon:yes stop_codon:yes gene_type:complete